MSNTVFSKPNCGNCEKTKEMLDEMGVEYNVVDISLDADARKMVKSWGIREAPAVLTASGAKWGGHNEAKILEHFGPKVDESDDDTWEF